MDIRVNSKNFRGKYKRSSNKPRRTRRTKEAVNRNFKAENRFYHAWEWNLLTPENRKAVQALPGRPYNEQNRHVQQVTTAPMNSEFTDMGDNMNRRTCTPDNRN